MASLSRSGSTRLSAPPVSPVAKAYEKHTGKALRVIEEGTLTLAAAGAVADAAEEKSKVKPAPTPTPPPPPSPRTASPLPRAKSPQSRTSTASLVVGDRVKKLKGAHAGMLGVVVDVHEGGAVRVKLDHVTRITNKQSGTNFEKQASAASPPKKQGKEETKEEEQQQEEGGERDKKETKKKTAKKKKRLFAFVGRVMDWFMKRSPKADEATGVEAIDTQALGRIQEAQTLALVVQKEEGRLSLKKARGGGVKSSSGKSSPPSPRPPPGRGLTFIPSRIEGVLYNSGRNNSLAREPYDKSRVERMLSGTQPLLVGAEPWWLDKNKPFGPAFTEASVKALPRAVREEESGDGVVLVKWHDQPPMSVSAWNAQLKAWDVLYPNIKHTDGSTPHETEKIRSSRTSSPAVIEACFAKLTKVWWTGVSSSAGRAMCAAFRPDMWGNLVCLPRSLGHKDGAQNNALTFFDVDHVFPYSRGGRSVAANLVCCQSAANRHMKADNLVQSLLPGEMLCGISSGQMLAMVKYIDASSLGRKTTSHYRALIMHALTSSPLNGESLIGFQKEVNRSLDPVVLVQYFTQRVTQQARLLGELLTGLPSGGPRLVVKVRGSLVEVGGPSNNATYHVKDDLYAAGYSWDKEDGRRCWFRGFSSTADKDAILLELQDLCRTKGFTFDLV